MTHHTHHAVSIDGLRRAIESHDAAGLAALYADDAVLRIVDRLNPPSRPREIRGRDQIRAYYDDVCGRDMTHHVDEAIASDRQLAFTETCEYAGGGKVFCAAMIDIEGDRIRRQTNIQAWDE